MRLSSQAGFHAGVAKAPPTGSRPARSVVLPASRPAAAGRRARLILATALAGTTLWAGAASWLLVFHDETLARFVSQQSAMQLSYEERIDALRKQIDRTATDRLVTRGGLEGRLSALAERQAAIETRQAQLASLGGALADGAPSVTGAIEPVPAAEPSAEPIPGRPQKPFPTPDALELRSRADEGIEATGRQSARETAGTLARLEERLDRLSDAQARILVGIAARAGRGAERLRAVLARTGLGLARFEGPPAGLGGPLVPVPSDAFALALAEAQRAVGETERLRRIAAALPLRRPLSGDGAPTSGFGTRLDPFTRGLALHTGLDLRADHGASARATGAGRVTAAEYAGGYGNMVEIDHGHGVTTRYAHLASFSASPGQWVAAGSVIGRVGSTGRSTGSHLHYETRIDGEPVDPQHFLGAGANLDATLVAAR